MWLIINNNNLMLVDKKVTSVNSILQCYSYKNFIRRNFCKRQMKILGDKLRKAILKRFCEINFHKMKKMFLKHKIWQITLKQKV